MCVRTYAGCFNLCYFISVSRIVATCLLYTDEKTEVQRHQVLVRGKGHTVAWPKLQPPASGRQCFCGFKGRGGSRVQVGKGPVFKRGGVNLKKPTWLPYPVVPWSLLSAQLPAKGLLSWADADMDFFFPWER